MEFKYIEYFLEASRHTSMSKAAESLFISQQALSRCIQNLEEELGCRLFTRTAKGSFLTAEGEYLRDQFEPFIEKYHSLENETLSHLSKQPRKVTFASAPLIFGVLDTEILIDFQKQYPKFELDMTEMSDMDVDRYIAEDPSHFGIIAKPEDWHGRKYSFVSVKTYPLCLYVYKDHPLARRKKVSFRELKDEPFMMMDQRSYFQMIIKEVAAKFGFEPKKAFESADPYQLCSLVNTGKGIFVATNNPTTPQIFKNIRVIPFKEKSLTYSIAFVFQNIEKLDTQDRTFMNFVIKACSVSHEKST